MDPSVPPRDVPPSSGPSYRSFLLRWALPLSLLPMLIMAAQGYHCAAQAVVESTVDGVRNVALARAIQIEDWIEDQRRELSYLARTACLPPECGPSCACGGEPDPNARACQLMETFRSSLAGYAGIAVIDREGEILGSIGRFPFALDRIDVERLRAVAASPRDEGHDVLLLDATSIDRTAGPRRLDAMEIRSMDAILLVAGLDSEATARGFLIAHIDPLPALSRILSRPTGLGDSGEAAVADREGRVIVRAPSSSLFDAESSDLRHALSANRLGGGVYTRDHGGGIVAGFAPILGLDLSVVVARDRKEALTWLPRLARRALVVGLLTALLVVFVSREMARRLSQPLVTLAEVARRVSRGDPVARVPALSGKEPNDVRLALNEMLDAQQRAQRELAHSSALAAIGELSTSVVHELRNPLTSVKMNLQALAVQVEDDRVHKELADIASAQVERMERMLGDLLDYGKPLAIETRDASMGEILDAVTGSVAALAREKGVSVRVRDEAAAMRIETDPFRLAQAIENLVRNAIEASPPGEEVTIRICREGGDAGERDLVAIYVEDRGKGLPAGSRDRLFQPFFTGKPGGTGLGLANVRKIVETLGGRVQAADREGGGARFRIALPDSREIAETRA